MRLGTELEQMITVVRFSTYQWSRNEKKVASNLIRGSWILDKTFVPNHIIFFTRFLNMVRFVCLCVTEFVWGSYIGSLEWNDKHKVIRRVCVGLVSMGGTSFLFNRIHTTRECVMFKFLTFPDTPDRLCDVYDLFLWWLGSMGGGLEFCDTFLHNLPKWVLRFTWVDSKAVNKWEIYRYLSFPILCNVVY